MTAKVQTTLHEDDERFMRRALKLAAKGKRTHPNPRVGAVVVTGGLIVGEGFHPKKGEPHAETFAFADAGDAARGATLYVTLEPCSFTGGGRTPCSRRCLAAGVSRVVVAMADPDERVRGSGIEQLRAAGVDVTVGVCENEARALNFAFIKHRTTGLPYVTHKAAMTLDGKIAAVSGDSRWVTGEAARAHVHRLRDRVDAIIAGIGTVEADDPSLTTRLPRGNVHDPLRVIIDSSLRISPQAKVARAGTLIATRQASLTIRPGEAEEIRATGAEVVGFPDDPASKRVDVREVCRYLANEKGALDILLEGGGNLAATFWESQLIDKVLYFVAPKIIGGEGAKTPVEGAGLSPKMADAVKIEKLSVRRFGADIALEGVVERQRQQ